MTEEADQEPLHPVDGSFTDLFRAPKAAPDYVIPDLLPVGITFLVGPPKDSYKSTISMAIACLVAGFKVDAIPPRFAACKKGTVFVFSYEASAGMLRFIVEDGMGIKGQPDESILVSDAPWEFRLDDEEAAEQLIFWLDERKPLLVIIDPLANFHAVEEKDAVQMIRILAPLQRWAKENGCAMLIVHHTRKLNEDRAYRADDVRGSSGIFGLADALLLITPKDQYEIMVEGKFKLSQGWLETWQLAIWGRKGKGGQVALREVDVLIINMILKGQDTVDKLLVHSGLGADTVKARLAAMRKMGVIEWKKGKVTVLRPEVVE